jgi:hypothetical protein
MHENNTRDLHEYLSSFQNNKNATFFLLSFVFSSTKLENKRAEQVLAIDSGGRREVAQVLYTHVNICNNNKIKFKKYIFIKEDRILAVRQGKSLEH